MPVANNIDDHEKNENFDLFSKFSLSLPSGDKATISKKRKIIKLIIK